MSQPTSAMRSSGATCRWAGASRADTTAARSRSRTSAGREPRACPRGDTFDPRAGPRSAPTRCPACSARSSATTATTAPALHVPRGLKELALRVEQIARETPEASTVIELADRAGVSTRRLWRRARRTASCTRTRSTARRRPGATARP